MNACGGSGSQKVLSKPGGTGFFVVAAAAAVWAGGAAPHVPGANAFGRHLDAVKALYTAPRATQARLRGGATGRALLGSDTPSPFLMARLCGPLERVAAPPR